MHILFNKINSHFKRLCHFNFCVNYMVFIPKPIFINHMDGRGNARIKI